MEENMNEEALTADGQKDDDIDYVDINATKDELDFRN